MHRRKSKKLMRVLIVFCVWLLIIFFAGGKFADAVRERDAQPIITEGVDLVGEGVPDEDKTPSQKKASDERKALNTASLAHDLGAISEALGISEWDVIGAENRDGIPALIPYFPKGQNLRQWREAFVVRAYVNVKVKNPAPFVYNIYNDWITMQLPDLQFKTVEDPAGNISFSGYSNSGKVFVSGKICTSSLETSVFILQYVIKNDGQPDVEVKAKRWQGMIEAIK